MPLKKREFKFFKKCEKYAKKTVRKYLKTLQATKRLFTFFTFSAK